MLSTLAKVMARSTGIVGYRGAGRVFRPLSALRGLRDVDGTAPLGPQRRITFPAFDPYWAQYLWTEKPYEPDVAAIFRALAPIPKKILVDCGANIGFWTVNLSDPAAGFEHLIAVEANPYPFGYLRKNVQLNGIQAAIHHAAIAREAGLTLHIDGSKGHAVGVVGDVGTPVHTVSLTSLLAGLGDSATPPLAVVKLDVEGYEVEAIKGAAGVRDLDLMYVYEDWPRSGMGVSDYLLSTGHTVIGVHNDGRAEMLKTLDAVYDFNRRSAAGYHPSNLVGTMRSDIYPM